MEFEADIAAELVEGSVDANATPDVSAPSGDTAAPSEPSYGFDSYDAFSATPWLSELPEDRRSYLNDGLRGLYEKTAKEKADWEQQLSEREKSLESATRDAETWKRFLEDAHPDFRDLNEQVKTLSEKAARADEAAAELADLKAKLATGDASVAEVRKALEEKTAAETTLKAAHDALRLELANTAASLEGEKARGEGLTESYYSVIEDIVAAALMDRYPDATERDLIMAMDAFHGAVKEPEVAEGQEPPAGWRRQAVRDGLAAAAASMPKPDKVPASVQAMNHDRGGGERSFDAKALAREYARADGNPMDILNNMSERTGLSKAKVLELIGEGSRQ